MSEVAWWAFVDFGGEHQLAVGECPDNEWTGPFDTFTEARQWLLDAGTEEAREIHARNVWWRSQTKRELADLGLIVGMEEVAR